MVGKVIRFTKSPISRIFAPVISLFLGDLTLQAMPRPANSALTETYAQYRSDLIKNVKYELEISLDPKSDMIDGHVDISFTSKTASPELSLDFADGMIESAIINGESFKAKVQNGGFELPAKKISAGRNRLNIKFQSRFSDDGSGMFKFVDKSDKSTYVFSDFEPFYANRLYPAFDQPDIKARFTLTVNVPTDWTVVSASSPRQISATKSGKKWEFKETPMLSTYVFSIQAGPFQIWNEEGSPVPTRLLARKSIAAKVDPKPWFQSSSKSIAYFQDYFAIPFPFEKNDLIFVPDLNSIGMENVGAVTFSEDYLESSTTNSISSLLRDEIISHELSHMWFGNLVTMKWWDDLWLNEATATYLSYLAMENALDQPQASTYFSADVKAMAYIDDQLRTTHPILSDIQNTDDALTHFDNITYNKGAAVLKQLQFLVGSETYRKAFHEYLTDFSFQNASMQDFMKQIEVSSKASVERWRENWLKTAGTNVIDVKWQCQPNGRIKTFDINQKRDSISGTLRIHRSRFALYTGSNQQEYKLLTFLDSNYENNVTSISSAVGIDCPDAVIPNYRDYDFARVRLDSGTLQKALTDISRFSDPQVRVILITSLWDSVINGEVSAVSFSKMLLEDFKKESDSVILDMIAKYVDPNYGEDERSIHFWIPRDQPAEKSQYQSLLADWETISNRRLQSSEPGTVSQRFFALLRMGLAVSPDSAQKIATYYHGGGAPRGLKMDAPMRWAALKALARLGHPDAEKWIASEAQKDQSNLGHKEELAALAQRPSQSAKIEMLTRFVTPESTADVKDKVTVMENLFNRRDDAAWSTIENRFYEMLPWHIEHSPEIVLDALTAHLAPVNCGMGAHQKLQKYFDRNQQSMPTIASKGINRALSIDQLCIRSKETTRRASQNEKSSASPIAQ